MVPRTKNEPARAPRGGRPRRRIEAAGRDAVETIVETDDDLATPNIVTRSAAPSRRNRRRRGRSQPLAGRNDRDGEPSERRGIGSLQHDHRGVVRAGEARSSWRRRGRRRNGAHAARAGADLQHAEAPAEDRGVTDREALTAWSAASKT